MHPAGHRVAAAGGSKRRRVRTACTNELGCICLLAKTTACQDDSAPTCHHLHHFLQASAAVVAQAKAALDNPRLCGEPQVGCGLSGERVPLGRACVGCNSHRQQPVGAGSNLHCESLPALIILSHHPANTLQLREADAAAAGGAAAFGVAPAAADDGLAAGGLLGTSSCCVQAVLLV